MIILGINLAFVSYLYVPLCTSQNEKNVRIKKAIWMSGPNRFFLFSIMGKFWIMINIFM